MTRHLAIHLSYHGGAFHGYELQPGQRSIRGEIEAALARLLQAEIKSTCAGRTDAGVHAYSQVVSFSTSHHLPVERFVPALNRLLPWDIRAHQSWEVPADFSARYSAHRRHYRYLVWTAQVLPPHFHGKVWHLKKHCDWPRLAQYWQSIQGEHNFAAFCKSGSYRQNTQIQVPWTQLWRYRDFWVFEIQGESFLYNMVRRLVGTTCAMAYGRLPEDQLQRALTSGDPKLVGPTTAPADGLYLYDVHYPPELGLELILPELHAWPVPRTPPPGQA